MSHKKLLVVGAHSADFVWRAVGSIALVTSRGGSATVLALSYGERGESGSLWKEPNQTVENVKRIRHEQASEAAGIVGATFRCLDLGDYPLVVTGVALEELVALFLDLQPDIVMTHTPQDPAQNSWKPRPTHSVTSQLVQPRHSRRSRSTAAAQPASVSRASSQTARPCPTPRSRLNAPGRTDRPAAIRIRRQTGSFWGDQRRRRASSREKAP